jgi:hypothetical protein
MRRIILIMAAIAIGIGVSLTLGASTGSAIGSGSGAGTNTDIVMPFPGGGSPMYCSPGYWKNHPEVWEAGICCIGLASDPQSQCGELDAQLRAQGPGSRFIREAAQAVLSACFADPPCEDD